MTTLVGRRIQIKEKTAQIYAFQYNVLTVYLADLSELNNCPRSITTDWLLNVRRSIWRCKTRQSRGRVTKHDSHVFTQENCHIYYRMTRHPSPLVNLSRLLKTQVKGKHAKRSCQKKNEKKSKKEHLYILSKRRL